MEIPKTIIDLEALLIALAQQTEPLPEYLQRSLKEIGRLLRCWVSCFNPTYVLKRFGNYLKRSNRNASFIHIQKLY
jgi:C4-dicarboxylate-specific signal transduction histidine kinase